MKKFIVAIIMLVVLVYVSTAFCAGTCTQRVDKYANNPNFAVLTVSCTGDSSTGAFPSTTITAENMAKITGFYITEVQTYPGTTNPTALYDIVINTSRGLDLMEGNLANRSASLPERAFPSTIVAGIANALTIVITGNSVASAVVVIQVLLGK